MKIASGMMMVAVLLSAGCSQQVEIANNDAEGLVAAIRRANATPGAEHIRLARRGLYVLTRESDPGLLLPAVRGKLSIDGNGAEIRGYTSARVALLEVGADADVDLKQLSLAEGSNGAIRNFGKLHMEATRVVDSTGDSTSAIVLNHGQLIASNSEVAYNALDHGMRDAGTVLNYGELQLHNTRIHDNLVQRARRGVVAAGAVLNLGDLQLQSARLDNNSTADAEDAVARPGFLSFPGVINLGNGRVEGNLPESSQRSVRTALPPLSDL